jgi:beta-galactosidase
LVQVAAKEAVEDHPNLIVPALYVVDDVTLDWLVVYAHAGGHLIIGPRTGYSDHEVRARSEVMPTRMTEAAGIWYDEFSNLAEPLAVTAPVGSPLVLDADAKAPGGRMVSTLRTPKSLPPTNIHTFLAGPRRQPRFMVQVA